MRLLQINTVINSGSTGRIAEEIGLRIIEKGGESFIAFGRKTERPSKSHKIQIGNKQDIFLHGIGTRLTDRHAFFSKKATEKLILQITKANPDIIHLHNLHGYYLNIEILFNYLSNVKTPIVWTLHDCWPITGHCTHFSYINCEKWKTHCNKCPQKKEYPTSFFIDNSCDNFEKKRKLFTSVENLTIVPVSYWLADLVNESFLQKYPIQVIHNGINSGVFKPTNTHKIKEKYNLFDKFILLGVASIWDKRKGLEDFIKLSGLLKKDEALILVGLTDKQIKLLPKNIIGIKRTEDIDELAELYSCSDIFVNPTWEDNFPTTNLEALACGTPVVTYKTGGSPEAISLEAGFVVEQGDITALRKVIDKVKYNGKNLYQEACRNRALLFFKKEDRFDEYIRLYKKLINKSWK